MRATLGTRRKAKPKMTPLPKRNNYSRRNDQMLNFRTVYKEHFLERQIKLKVELKWAFFVLAFKWFINLTG